MTTRGIPGHTGRKAVLRAKRDFVLEALRAWAGRYARAMTGGVALEREVDLFEAWREYEKAERGQ